MNRRNVILIGARGSGKTTVGRRLAGRLGWSFVDTDEQIVSAVGMPIREFFEQEGEPAFRRHERAAIARAVRGRAQVIAVGGGAVLDAANRAALRKAGVCIWLAAPATVLWRRIRADRRTARTRPPLTAHRGLAEVRHLLAERRPLYAALAQHVVQTGRRSIADVVRAVLTALAEDGVQPDGA